MEELNNPKQCAIWELTFFHDDKNIFGFIVVYDTEEEEVELSHKTKKLASNLKKLIIELENDEKISSIKGYSD
jgi:hypothetical protein